MNRMLAGESVSPMLDETSLPKETLQRRKHQALVALSLVDRVRTTEIGALGAAARWVKPQTGIWWVCPHCRQETRTAFIAHLFKPKKRSPRFFNRTKAKSVNSLIRRILDFRVCARLAMSRAWTTGMTSSAREALDDGSCSLADRTSMPRNLANKEKML